MSTTIGQVVSNKVKEQKTTSSSSALDKTYEYLVDAILNHNPTSALEITVGQRQGMLRPRDVDNWIELLLRLRKQDLSVETSHMTVYDDDDRMPTSSQAPAYTVFVVEKS